VFIAVTCNKTFVKAASSSWTSLIISNPHLESHLVNSTLMPSPISTEKGLPTTKAQYITSFDPASGYHLDTFPADSEFDIAEKISQARRAWTRSRWAESSFGERKRLMRTLLRWVCRNRETCARVACRDTGKTSEWF
jgi:acyl-CoA reductase-like NAD-dependent aldehyde dehydrogenase